MFIDCLRFQILHCNPTHVQITPVFEGYSKNEKLKIEQTYYRLNITKILTNNKLNIRIRYLN